MDKTNEQLHKEVQDALKVLSEKLYNLLHYGSYSLDYVNRDFETNAVNSASLRFEDAVFLLRMDGKFKFLEKEGSEVTVILPDNPIDQKLLDAWDSQTIDKDIAYHIKQLKSLRQQKVKLKEKYGQGKNNGETGST